MHDTSKPPRQAVPHIVILRDTVARGFPLGRQELTCALTAMLDAVGAPDARIELHLCGDARVETLNTVFLGCRGPTNILSFPDDNAAAPEPACGGSHGETCGYAANGDFSLGSLALSVHACEREARLYGQRVEEHCLRLLAHGLAHLLGLDHGEEMDELSEAAFTAARYRCPDF